MGLMVWLEKTQLGEYMRVSVYGYAVMLSLHALGLAVMVGLSVVLSLRTLGFFRELPYEILRPFLRIAWIGFVVNVLSGFCIFAMQATTYVTDREFLVKIVFVLLGAGFVALLQGTTNREAKASGGVVAAGREQAFYAMGAIVSWSIAMIAGRLIAYL
jgi:hypothetical protein